MKRIKKSLKNPVFWIVSICIISLAAWISNSYLHLLDCFFGSEVPPADIVIFAGLVCSIIVILSQIVKYTNQNAIIKQGVINNSIKESAHLLNSAEVTHILLGINGLHQQAVEVARNGKKGQQGYVKVVHDIFCDYLRKNVDIKNGQRICTQPTVIIQAIVDVLFTGGKKSIYKKYRCDLSGAVFENITLADMVLTNVCFNKATMINVGFYKAKLSYVQFYEADLTNVDFRETKLNRIGYNCAKLTDVKFTKATLKEIDFSDAMNTIEANSIRSKTILQNIDFTGTKLGEKSPEEVVEKSWELTQ